MSMAPQPRVRVMVVEDSLVVRQLLVHIIASDPRLLVAAAVSSAEEALQEIDAKQGKGSAQAWWAFEGFTHVDASFETDACLLLIEGKRTETVSSSTRWFKSRNQLWRNVEVAGELPALPLGYHDLRRDGGTGTTRLIVSPGRCHLSDDLHTWGLAVQLYAARSTASCASR